MSWNRRGSSKALGSYTLPIEPLRTDSDKVSFDFLQLQADSVLKIANLLWRASAPSFQAGGEGTGYGRANVFSRCRQADSVIGRRGVENVLSASGRRDRRREASYRAF